MLHFGKVDQVWTKRFCIAPPHKAISVHSTGTSDGQMLEMFGGHDVLFPGPIVPVIGDLKDCTCFEVELGVVSGELDRSNDVLAWARDDDSSALGVVQVLLNRGRRVVVVGGDGAIGAMDVDAHVPTLEGGGVGDAFLDKQKRESEDGCRFHCGFGTVQEMERKERHQLSKWILGSVDRGRCNRSKAAVFYE